MALCGFLEVLEPMAMSGNRESAPAHWMTGDWLQDHLAADLTTRGYLVQPIDSSAGLSRLSWHPSFIATSNGDPMLAFIIPAKSEPPQTAVDDLKQALRDGYSVTVACADRATFDWLRSVTRRSRIKARLVCFERHRKHHKRDRASWGQYMRRRGSQYALWLLGLAVMQVVLVLSFRACEVIQDYQPKYYEPKDIEREIKKK